MEIQYGIFNDFTEDDLNNIDENKRWLTEQIGATLWDASYAQIKCDEINEWRASYRDEQPEKPLSVDELVSRPVKVKIRKRTVQFTEWTDVVN